MGTDGANLPAGEPGIIPRAADCPKHFGQQGLAGLGSARRGQARRGLGSYGHLEGMAMSVRFEFTLTGIRPLLMHADDPAWGDVLKEWQTDPANRDISKAGDDRSPGFTWLGYLPDDGQNAAIPSSYIAASLRDAGKAVRIGKGQKTYKEAASSAVWLDSEFFPLLNDGKPIPMASIRSRLCEVIDFREHLATARRHGFDLDMRRAKVGQSKHVRIRPRFNRWSLVGNLELADPEILRPEVLAQLFDIAGRRGLGDYRPGSKSPGPFGMFTAELKPIK
jgi:hypothetical protein